MADLAALFRNSPLSLLNATRMLLVLWLVSGVGASWAMTVDLDHQDGAPLGRQVQYLQEQGGRLTLADAITAEERGEFRSGRTKVASYGLDASPVWMHLRVRNPHVVASPFQLQVGTTWIDFLDVYVMHDGRLLQSWNSGDGVMGAQYVEPGAGYGFPISFMPGESDVYIRAQTVDPLLLPVSLLPESRVMAAERGIQYGYGLMYGYLLALIAFNLMLFGGIRIKSHFYYALYLLSFIGLNLCYTGHGLAWWWPYDPGFQRYVILAMMVFCGCCGFLFAARFLELRTYAPRLRRGVEIFCAGGILLMVLAVIGHNQSAAVWVAFCFFLLYAVGMVLLGIVTLRKGQIAGRYFLLASVCGMFGMLSTTLSVWGWIPLNTLSYHGAEIGIMLEATLLALALANRMRIQEEARKDAERLARIDLLTELPNRRAFEGAARDTWKLSQRHRRPLSVIVLDIDHFKRINDQFGHDAGDSVLVAVARMLEKSCRGGDMVSRWGGEEFILLLPETELVQASALAERIRQTVEATSVDVNGEHIRLTASLGVAQYCAHTSLDELIRDADQWLYAAKRQGRNQVSYASTGVQEAVFSSPLDNKVAQ